MRAKAKIIKAKKRRRRAKTHPGGQTDHGSAARAGARTEDHPADPKAGAALNVNITRVVGTFCRFWFVDNKTQKTVATSELYDNHDACKAELIKFIQAIQTDDFESFDYT